MNKLLLLVSAFVGAEAKLALSKYAPVTFQATGGACKDIACKPIQCNPPFKWVNAETNGSCCAVCLADSIEVPEDRSWAKGLSGGIGADPNAPKMECSKVTTCNITYCFFLM